MNLFCDHEILYACENDQTGSIQVGKYDLLAGFTVLNAYVPIKECGSEFLFDPDSTDPENYDSLAWNVEMDRDYVEMINRL